MKKKLCLCLFLAIVCLSLLGYFLPWSGHYFYVLPTLGDYYIDGTSSRTTISFLSDKRNPLLHQLTAEENIQAIGFNHNTSDIQVTSFEIVFTDLSGLDNSFFLRNTAFVKYFLDFELSDQADITELTSVQILTDEKTYSFEIGSITVRQKAKQEDSGLLLKSHLATTAGAGLTYYDVEYKNCSDDCITVTEVNPGSFSQFPANLYINRKLMEDDAQLSYEIAPGEILSIEITYDENGPFDTPYDVFFFSPLVTVERNDVSYELYAPYSTNGLALTGAEIKSLVEEIQNMPSSVSET